MCTTFYMWSFSDSFIWYADVEMSFCCAGYDFLYFKCVFKHCILLVTLLRNHLLKEILTRNSLEQNEEALHFASLWNVDTWFEHFLLFSTNGLGMARCNVSLLHLTLVWKCMIFTYVLPCTCDSLLELRTVLLKMSMYDTAEICIVVEFLSNTLSTNKLNGCDNLLANFQAIVRVISILKFYQCSEVRPSHDISTCWDK